MEVLCVFFLSIWWRMNSHDFFYGNLVSKEAEHKKENWLGKVKKLQECSQLSQLSQPISCSTNLTSFTSLASQPASLLALSARVKVISLSRVCGHFAI